MKIRKIEVWKDQVSKPMGGWSFIGLEEQIIHIVTANSYRIMVRYGEAKGKSD